MNVSRKLEDSPERLPCAIGIGPQLADVVRILRRAATARRPVGPELK